MLSSAGAVRSSVPSSQHSSPQANSLPVAPRGPAVSASAPVPTPSGLGRAAAGGEAPSASYASPNAGLALRPVPLDSAPGESLPPPAASINQTATVDPSQTSPASIPSNYSPAPGDPQNHWWDLWSYSSASAPFNGEFVAGSNDINGYSGGDQILLLPMNIALGSTSYLDWFQFDIEYFCGSNLFGCSNGVNWYIWNIISPEGTAGCNPSNSQFNSYDISSSPPGPGGGVITSSGGGGLSYNPGDAYTWSLYQAVDGGAVFYVKDIDNGNFWWTEFSVLSFNLVVNSNCFSPTSGIEGYTSSSDSSFSDVGFVQFNLQQSDVPPASEAFEGSGEPSGIQTSSSQYDGSNSGGGNWYWNVFPSGSQPDALITSFNAPSSIDVGQTAHISFTATNVGAQAVTETMTMEFADASAGDISVASTDLDSAAVVSAGSSFPGCYDMCSPTLSNPLVEGRSDNWGSRVTHTLDIHFTPSKAGTYKLYYKTVATGGYSSYPISWSPDSDTSTARDQQHEWAYLATITVTVPVSITLLNDFTSNPISGANYFTAQYTSGGNSYTAYFTGSSTLTLHADGGTDVKISGESSNSDGNEKWCFTNSCDGITLKPDSSPITVTYYYFDLLRQHVSAHVVGGSGTIPLFYTTAPPLLYASDSPLVTHVSLSSSSETIDMLRGTQASLYACTPFTLAGGFGSVPLIQCDSDTWNILPGTATSYTITSADQLPSKFTYYQQYEEQLQFSTSDGDTPPSSPTFTSTQFGKPYSTALSMTSPVTVWLDAGAAYSITPNPLTGSTSTEQWVGGTVLLNNVLIEPLLPFNTFAEYFHQYLVNFGQSGLDSSAGTSPVLTVWESGSVVPTGFVYGQFPVADWIDAGTSVTYTYSSPIPGSPGAQFVLQSTTGTGSPFTVTGTLSITGNFASQATAVATCAGTSPTDTCTGTPNQDGSLSATSTATGVGAYITGTSATGTVTITATNYGTTPPASGADINLGAAGYYDVMVSGATDGVALVCITSTSVFFLTTMQYWNGASWVPASNVEATGDTVCGDVPVSALNATPLASGPPAGQAPCYSLTSSSDGCSGTPVDGDLTATSLDTNIVVNIGGTTATGLVTITLVNDGPAPPPIGPDDTLTGATYYDVKVDGAQDGTATICISSPFNTAMDYGAGGSWVPAAGVQVSTTGVCGSILVSALTGTPIAIGNLAPPSTIPGVPQFPLQGAGFLGVLFAVLLPVLLLIKRRGATTAPVGL